MCHWVSTGETPHPAEVLTVVRVSDTKVAFKTAYDRYVAASTSGELAGQAEAVGPREQWELVFEEVREGGGQGR